LSLGPARLAARASRAATRLFSFSASKNATTQGQL
jgi:hypothetical protein